MASKVFAIGFFGAIQIAFPVTTWSLEPESVSVQPDRQQVSTEAKSSPSPKANEIEIEEFEAAAMQFVERHHPELVSLLQLLKSMKEKEYQSAIREIIKVQRRLEPLEKRDPESHAIEVEAWKTQSKIDLLLARSVAEGKEVDVDALRKLVKRQIETQRQRMRHERTVLAERQKLLKENLEKLEAEEAQRVEQQVVALKKRIQSKITPPKSSKTDAKQARDTKAK